MLHNMINLVSGLGRNKLRGVLLSGAMLAGLPAAAMAHHPEFRLDLIVPAPPVVLVPAPQCEPAPQRVWVEPVYRTVTERVWIPAVTRTEIQRVDVPAQYGYRDITVLDRHGYPHIRQVSVLICPAHCEDRTVDEIVCPGHYEDQTRQQLVCEGHWQDRQQQEPVDYDRADRDHRGFHPRFRLEIPLPF